MNTYRVWAVQVLHDAKDIEAESAEEAEQIAKRMYQDQDSDTIEKYGDLDPCEIADGSCGVVGIEEWVFETRPAGSLESEIATELGLKGPCTCQ